MKRTLCLWCWDSYQSQCWWNCRLWQFFVVLFCFFWGGDWLLWCLIVMLMCGLNWLILFRVVFIYFVVVLFLLSLFLQEVTYWGTNQGKVTTQNTHTRTHTHTQTRGQFLKKITEKYSIRKGKPVEVTTRLRVLGVPIGNKDFFVFFIQDMLKKTITDTNLVVIKLESTQIMIQLFKTCTVHKLTHLFSCDVPTTIEYPRHWNMWDSQQCKDFTKW